MQSLGRPFIYFSEAVSTPNRAVNIIEECANRVGAVARLSPAKVWMQSALSVRSQAQLQRLPGYKGEKFNKWSKNCAETVSTNFAFEDPSDLPKFREDLVSRSFKPNAYYVPQEIRELLADLEAHNVGWGVIANDSHSYLAVSKMLNLKPPGPILQAQGPQMFKPLPQMWQRAVEKAPVGNRHNSWFIGSQQNPCDNMNANGKIRCALISHTLSSPEPISAHFRVPHIDNLRPYLLPSLQPEPALNLGFLEEPLVEEEGNDDDVVCTSFRPVKVPERKEPESSLFELRKNAKKM